MDHKAAVLALLLVSSTLAGCTGDPDAGGGDEFNSEALQDLIDENLQDFLNNTTITVINNYHNNTTYVIDDSSNTSYNFGGASFGSGANGTVTGGNMMFVAHVTFTAMDLFPDHETADYRNNTFTYNYTYYDYLTNQERTEDFTFSCQVYYLIGSLSNGSSFQVSYWEDESNGSGGNNYWNAWDNEYNSTIADLLEQAGWAHDVRSTCDEDYIATMPIKDGTDGWQYNFLSIDIPQGYAIEYLQLNSLHQYYGCSSWLSHYSCTELDQGSIYDRELTDFYNWSEGINPAYQEWYYGGWENITIDFDIKFRVCDEGYGCSPSSNYWGDGSGYYSVWPTSVYEFTLYYQFVPVIPIE